ncbi:hypothetical protein EG327_009292 [Venturia inaequalis]|uniref:Zn(2)-C6 fungal-type domain-containing protein n=1 Tax=Venturia inaequalis TaxID=5025 RepID=A0A8H3ULV2_VENIN|nr:hypothetical protein EG327_009292 [Venturia inaequalis]
MLQISNLTPDSFADGADPPDVQRPRKRQRKVLSCDACHRQKVKCDRKLPCSRCVAGNREDRCVYEGGNEPSAVAIANHLKNPTAVMHQPSPAASDSPTAIQPNRRPVGTTWRKGRARFSGMTHWAQLAFQFEEAAPFMRGSELASLMNKVKQLKRFYPPKRLRSFPFGDAGGDSVLSAHPRLSFLPPRSLAEQLVENYINTYETIHPLLDIPTFRDEFSRLWTQPESVTDAWLVQVYLMIALSCYSAHDISFVGVVDGHAGLSERCVDGAEAAIMARGLFVTKPDLTILRAFCMLLIAKRIDIITLDDLGSQWTLLGFVQRVAMSIYLHIGTAAFPTMPEAEAAARSRIWNTIMILDAYVSLDSGMPMLIRPDDYTPSALLGPEAAASPTTQSESSDGAKSSDPLQNLLAEAMPTITLVLNKVNSPSPTLDPVQLLACGRTIRQFLNKAQSSLPFPQNRLVEVLLLRCSIAIHQPRPLEGGSTEEPSPTLLRTLNQNSLALLQMQRTLCEQPSRQWLADLFHRDFGIAGLVVAVGLRKHTFNDKLVDAQFSRTAAWVAFKGVHAMVKENVLRSRHYFKIFRSFSVLTGILEALETGASIREAVYKSGLMVLSHVEESVGRQFESKVFETLPLDPILTGQPDVNFDPSSFGFDDFINDFFW